MPPEKERALLIPWKLPIEVILANIFPTDSLPERDSSQILSSIRREKVAIIILPLHLSLLGSKEIIRRRWMRLGSSQRASEVSIGFFWR